MVQVAVRKKPHREGEERTQGQRDRGGCLCRAVREGLTAKMHDPEGQGDEGVAGRLAGREKSSSLREEQVLRP